MTDFPGGTVEKNLPTNAKETRDMGSIPGMRRSPVEGNGNPLLPGKSHGQRSLVGYSPRGHKESDRTEQLHFHFHLPSPFLFAFCFSSFLSLFVNPPQTTTLSPSFSFSLGCFCLLLPYSVMDLCLFVFRHSVY